MWFIKQKLNGIDSPASLTPEMIPPSMRKVGETIVVTYSNILLTISNTYSKSLIISLCLHFTNY